MPHWLSCPRASTSSAARPRRWTTAPRATALYGHPTDTFDVEPPYEPDDAALAAVEKFDDRFLDRELSWLQLNQRVLELAEDE